MAEPTFSMTADDDLPRTIRREREAQREARERERQAREREAAAVSVPSIEHEGAYGALASPPATVTDIDVPFVRLMTFFIKAVFAAIPALVVLTAILWLFGQVAVHARARARASEGRHPDLSAAVGRRRQDDGQRPGPARHDTGSATAQMRSGRSRPGMASDGTVPANSAPWRS